MLITILACVSCGYFVSNCCILLLWQTIIIPKVMLIGVRRRGLAIIKCQSKCFPYRFLITLGVHGAPPIGCIGHQGGEKCVQSLTNRESADLCWSFCCLFSYRFAIYIPLFLPIGLPIIGSMFAAIKWFRGGKNESGTPESQKSNKPKTEWQVYCVFWADAKEMRSFVAFSNKPPKNFECMDWNNKPPFVLLVEKDLALRIKSLEHPVWMVGHRTCEL